MLKVTLEEIMSDHPVKVKETVSVGNVAHLLLRYRINGIIVVKEDDENCLAGIFTTSDLLRLLDQVIAEGGHRIEELHKVAELPV
ncbi:MAG: CBS domain-containing protein, partial [Candidatus Omnitrophota bacterium]